MVYVFVSARCDTEEKNPESSGIYSEQSCLGVLFWKCSFLSSIFCLSKLKCDIVLKCTTKSLSPILAKSAFFYVK